MGTSNQRGKRTRNARESIISDHLWQSDYPINLMILIF